MEITRKDIIDYVRRLPVSAQLKGRFRAYVLDKFPTVAAFLAAKDPELRKLENYGKNMAWVVTAVKDEFWRRAHEAQDRVLMDQRVQEAVEKLEADYEKLRAALNPVLTLAELQGIVSMMQLMNLDEIDLATIRRFLDSVRVKQRDAS